MPWNLLLLPLLGGFVCLDWCFYSRLRAQRIEGNRLLLEGAFAGAWLTIVTYAAVWAVSKIPAIRPVMSWWAGVVPHNLDYLGTALIAFCIGPATALLINWFVRRTPARLYTVKRYAIEGAGEHLLALLHEAAYRGDLVELTTTKRKVYTAFVWVAPDLNPENFVVLLPVLIGFEDKDTLQTRYVEKRYSWLRPDQAQVVIPLKSIESSRFVELADLHP